MKIRSAATLFLPGCVLVFLCVFTLHAHPGDNATTGIRVEYGAICRAVVDRVPVSTGNLFSNDIEKLYCFTHIKGAKQPTHVVHQWLYEGEMVFSIELPVLSPSWRTYSAKQIPPHQTGEWVVEILSQGGLLLQQLFFIVQGE